MADDTNTNDDQSQLIPDDENTQMNPTGAPQVPTDRQDIPEELMNAGEDIPPAVPKGSDSPETLDEDINQSGGRPNWP